MCVRSSCHRFYRETRFLSEVREDFPIKSPVSRRRFAWCVRLAFVCTNAIRSLNNDLCRFCRNCSEPPRMYPDVHQNQRSSLYTHNETNKARHGRGSEQGIGVAGAVFVSEHHQLRHHALIPLVFLMRGSTIPPPILSLLCPRSPTTLSAAGKQLMCDDQG